MTAPFTADEIAKLGLEFAVLEARGVRVYPTYVRLIRDLVTMAAREARLRAALQVELDALQARTTGSTHWDGCASSHPACAALQRIRAALAELQDQL